jgi:hypothetical protein
MAAAARWAKKFSVQEITFTEVDASDPRFYVIAGVEVPRDVFRYLNYHTSEYGGYWHGVLSEYWEVSNFPDFLAEKPDPQDLVIRPRQGSSHRDILLPASPVVVQVSRHERIGFEN